MKRNSDAERKRPHNLEKVNENGVTALHEHRKDQILSSKFIARLQHWADEDPAKMKQLALLALREVGGWSYTMLGLFLGRNPASAKQLVDEARAAIPKSIAKYYDHRDDGYVMIRDSEAELFVKFCRKLEPFITDPLVWQAIESLESQLAEKAAAA